MLSLQKEAILLLFLMLRMSSSPAAEKVFWPLLILKPRTSSVPMPYSVIATSGCSIANGKGFDAGSVHEGVGVYFKGNRWITSARFYRIANNLIVDEFRKKDKQSVSLEDLHEKDGSRVTTHCRRSNPLSTKYVLATLNKVEKKYREVLIMRYVDHLSPAEIAAITNETWRMLFPYVSIAASSN